MNEKQTKKKSKDSLWVFLAVVLGIACGIVVPHFMLAISFIGEIFFNMLKGLVIPLIVSAIITAIATIGDPKKLGTLGLYTLSYAVLSACVAVSIGLFLFNFFTPGIGVDTSFASTFSNDYQEAKTLTIATFLTDIIPPNLIEAVVKFEIIPVVIFSVAFAIACISCGEKAKNVVSFFSHLRNVMIKLISWVIKLSPIGVFSLLGTAVAKSAAENHLEQDFKVLFMFVLVFMAGLLLQFLWQLIIIRFFVKHSISFYLKTTSPALATAFATSSSLAALPVSMLCAENAGVREDVNRFVLPLAATINLGATVMYEACAAIFFAQIMGLHLTLAHQVVIFFVSIIAGMGATGIPEGGIITMVTVLRAVNIPVGFISIILPLDRILDRFRTIVNTWGDICCASVVNKLLIKRDEMNSIKKKYTT